MKTVAAWCVALSAVAFLALMAWTGAHPQRSQHVKFEARGLLREDPARVEAVLLTDAAGPRTFTRHGKEWQEAQRTLAPQAAAALDSALHFLHRSEPVRSIALAEVKAQGPSEFGLAPPRLTVKLLVGGASVLEAGFGATNTTGRLDYVGVMDHDQLYLLSHFVLEEWLKVLAEPQPGTTR